MNTAFDRRLDRAESVARNIGYGRHTMDEINVGLFKIYRQLSGDPTAPEDERMEAARKADEIATDILNMARKQARPEYARHLAYVAATWGGLENYIPALTGASCGGMMEYDGWFLPNLMQRRAELRARPDVAELLRMIN